MRLTSRVTPGPTPPALTWKPQPVRMGAYLEFRANKL